MAKIKLDPRKYFQQTIVVDASILIKAFLKEPGWEVIDKLMEMHWKNELTILATSLLNFEFLNIIARSVKTKEMAEEALKNFRDLKIPRMQLDEKFVEEAVKSVFENKKISYYDASYHALAKNFDTVFLTADKKYYELMKHKGNVELFV